jgi:hypothetical protein
MNSLPIIAGRGVKTRLKGLEKVISNQLEVNTFSFSLKSDRSTDDYGFSLFGKNNFSQTEF